MMFVTAANPHQKRSEKLLSVVRPYERLVIIMHDTPDPDAIATAWALKFLLEERTDKPVRMIAGGAIARAENRHLVKLLEPPLELLDDYQFDRRTGAILVDCGVEASNHLVSGKRHAPVAVIDHHLPEHNAPVPPQEMGDESPTDSATPLLDIRPDVAASATIAATYLREQKLEPDIHLATALLYAIRTETRAYETHYSKLDRSVLPWLMRRADPSLMAEIENAPLPPAYFADLALALQNSFVYGDALFCMLPRATGPETIGEVADLLVRREGVRRVLCAAVYNGSVLLSVRTDKEGGNATHLLRETIRDIGRGGGHTHRAGGKLTEATASDKVPEELQDELRTRWLKACGISRQRGTRLLPKRQILKHL